MRLLITVLLLLVTLSSVLHASPFKSINRETGSESTTGHLPTAFQLDREVTVLERIEMPSAAAPNSSVTSGNMAQHNITDFAGVIESQHSDLPHRKHTLRI
jgi:hypothetical protein